MRPLAVLFVIVALWPAPVPARGPSPSSVRGPASAPAAPPARIGIDRGPASDAAITVVSLNLALREDEAAIASDLAAIGADDADVLLLQEVVRREGEPDVAARLAARLGLASVYRPAFTLDDGRSIGQATLSRFRWHATRVVPLARFDLNIRSRTRIALAVALDTPAGRLQTYNVHLDTRLNLDDRLAQIAAMMDDVGATDGPAVVGGDFNTNSHRWLFHLIPVPFVERQGRGLERFMTSNGFDSPFAGAGPTHDALRMRLDWMFLRDLEASARSIHPMDISDHHALVVVAGPAG